jgi:hypothetical protein
MKVLNLIEVRSLHLANPILKPRVFCSAFKTGMQCFDLYAVTCLNGDERKVMNRNVAGARHAFSYLCDDPSFQTGNNRMWISFTTYAWTTCTVTVLFSETFSSYTIKVWVSWCTNIVDQRQQAVIPIIHSLHSYNFMCSIVHRAPNHCNNSL